MHVCTFPVSVVEHCYMAKFHFALTFIVSLNQSITYSRRGPVMKGGTKFCRDLLAMVWERLMHNMQLVMRTVLFYLSYKVEKQLKWIQEKMVYTVNMRKCEIYFWIRHVVCGPWYATPTHLHTYCICICLPILLRTLNWHNYNQISRKVGTFYQSE